MHFIYLFICLIFFHFVNTSAHASNYRKAPPRCLTAKKPPNILFILVDELQFPVVYQNENLIQWSQQNLTTMNFLKNNGVNFNNHYCGATACAPSRTTLFTGQYPTLHGVSQTDGAAKPQSDPTMFWLSPYTVPTAGNIFSQSVYANYYIGKWHISRDDLFNPGTQEPVLSYDMTTGEPDQYLENAYQAANMLGPYGFNNGWIGPEPHGSDPHQSGGSAAVGVSGRDIFYADQTVELLTQLDAQGSTQPWFIVCSFVNPHDIALYGNITQTFPTFNFDVDPTLPFIPPAPTANENLSTKPTAQSSYQTEYQIAFQSTTDTLQYRQLYYTLQKKVDIQMGRVLNTLLNSSFRNNTIVVFTSDHGDLLGSHGNFQKWFNMYEESIHVPLIFYSPTLLPQGVNIDNLITSHVDILPTLCGLAGINVNQITDQFQTTYTNSRTLVGRDLSSVVTGTATSDQIAALQEPILFITYDQVLTGAYTENPLGDPYTYVAQPAFIDAVITVLNGQTWKFAMYFENMSFATAPLSCTCSTPLPNPPPPIEYEMYNLTLDPIEANNLAGMPIYAGIQAQLTAILLQQMQQKALQPTNSQPYIPIIPPPS
jgi:arylsulfatase A-like enzyme